MKTRLELLQPAEPKELHGTIVLFCPSTATRQKPRRNFVHPGTEDFFPGNVNNLWPRDIIIRRERQTFRRLPKINAVVFTVKTTITPLVQFPKEELEGLAAEIRPWPEDIREGVLGEDLCLDIATVHNGLLRMLT